ncbi:MAG: hypothetical protein ACK4YQ_04245 [Phenylobacterium sp.]|uniref:hypothetical protein n=1 Tax=Phenylobacterium sp. TaxID=1871053 RepID=UPI00391DD3D7
MDRPWLTPRGRRRPLTAGEAALCAEVFGEGLDPVRVRLWAQPLNWPTRAFVAGPRLVVWPWRAALADFTAPGVRLGAQAMFVHEMTHVWQAQNGVNLLLAKLRAGDGPRAYAYDLGSGREFADLNIEQQAMVVEHAFVASRGGTTPHDAAAYAALRDAWRRA